MSQTLEECEPTMRRRQQGSRERHALALEKLQLRYPDMVFRARAAMSRADRQVSASWVRFPLRHRG